MDDSTVVAAWITSALASLSAGIYEGVAPVGAAEPYIVFSFVTAPDTATVSGDIVWTRPDVDVKAVCEGGSFTPLTSLAAGIHAALHGVRYESTDNGTIYASRRVASIRYTETSGGKVYRHLGGTYRIQAKGE